MGSRLIAGSTDEGLVHKVQGTAGSDSNLKIREDTIMGPVIKGGPTELGQGVQLTKFNLGLSKSPEMGNKV